MHAGRSLQPDAVVSLGGWNDFHQLRAGHAVPEYEEQMQRRLVIARRAEDPNPLRRWAYGTATTFFPALSRRIGRAAGFADGADAALAADPERSAREYAANVVRLARVSAATGAAFLAVVQPDRCEMDVRLGVPERDGCAAEFAAGYTRFREIAVTTLRGAGVEVVDLGENDRELPAELFTDPVHLTAVGYERLADLLAPRLSRRSTRSRVADGAH